MTDNERRKKNLKTAKSYGLYQYEIDGIKARARKWDISASQYVEAMHHADRKGMTTQKLLTQWKAEADRRGVQLNMLIEEITRTAS